MFSHIPSGLPHRFKRRSSDAGIIPSSTLFLQESNEMRAFLFAYLFDDSPGKGCSDRLRVMV
jgi:hypothetical protein